MSFEIKYNPDGTPVKNQMPEEIRVASDEASALVREEAEMQNHHGLDSSVLQKVESSDEDSNDLEAADSVAQEPTQKVAPKPSESWKVMRERVEAAERKAQLAEEALLNAQRSSQNIPQEQPNLDYSINDDDLVEGRHLSKVDQKIKNLEAKLRQYEQQTVLSATEVRLKQQYPDFDSVVSSENIANLSAAYPELATSINHSPDLYTKAVSAYTLIKKLGIGVTPDTYESDRALVQKNAAKPKSLASIDPHKSESPLTRANAFASKGPLTDEMKAQAIREMNAARKGY